MTATKPNAGMMRNCMATPVPIANLFCHCRFKFLTSTVADRPKIKKNSSRFETTTLRMSIAEVPSFSLLPTVVVALEGAMKRGSVSSSVRNDMLDVVYGSKL